MGVKAPTIGDPMGAKAPDVAADSKVQTIFRDSGKDFAMFCYTQAYPVPLFSSDLIIKNMDAFNLSSDKLGVHDCTDPMGAKAPDIPTDDKTRTLYRISGHDFPLFCYAQAHPLPAFRKYLCSIYLEPIGAKAPTFAHDATSSSYLRKPVGRVAPKFPKSAKSNSYEWLSGGTCILLCEGQAFPMPTFRWYKFVDGTSKKQPVLMSDRVKQVSGTLIIREAKVEDSGKYLCVVNNSVGGESVETVLTVTAPLVAGVEPSVQTVDFGRPALFTCNYEGNPVKTVSWLKDGKAIAGHNGAVLKIESVRKEDKGMYQCFVRNEQESAQASAELKLGSRFEPPVITKGFDTQTLQPGPAINLKCIGKGNPTPEITWYLDEKKLINTDRLQVGQYVGVNGEVVSFLNITKAHSNDGGLYKCVASSKVGVFEHAQRVNVYGLPYVRAMEKKAIVAGETLIVTCPVAGYPIESIVWERDGRVLPINRKQKVFPNGTLIIENVERLSDQATYTCVAKNGQGYSSRGTLEVQVMEKTWMIFNEYSYFIELNPNRWVTRTFGFIWSNAKKSTIFAVLVLPFITPFQFDGAVNAGDNVQLACHVSKGDIPLRIEWHFQGEGTSSHAMGVKTSMYGDKTNILDIDSVGPGNRGEYTCTATNSAGSANYSAILLVNQW
ncbi:hypothetical protein O3M35_007639 [Rhynocoris fuscipes]|uniref:Ig-like domain-containing protein n=1 Tax=Rhynocoris fuscipes TaxID=488301 RepID=A0AAW1DCS2_9HEMI